MIKKIFYSLVLFPKIQYKNIYCGFYLTNIVELDLGKIELVFFNGNKNEKIIFTHIDFIEDKNKLLTKNWKIDGKNESLLSFIFDIIIQTDIHDFNFYKSKDFYNKIPFGAVLNITTKCNLFCNYCFNYYDYSLDKRNIKEGLGLKEYKFIVDKLYKNGTRDIILTGGEPFSCNFLFELLDYIKSKNIFIRINTNGTLLSDKILEKINKNYSLHLMISMHEFNNKDFYELNKLGAKNILGLKDLLKWEKKYEEKIKQIKKIHYYKNISYDFLTILTNKNIVNLDKIYSYVLSNFSILDWHFFRLQPTGFSLGSTANMLNLAVHKIYKLNIKYNKTYKIVDAVPFCITKNVLIASKTIDGELSIDHNVKLIITHEGNIQLMCSFDKNLGNIFEDDLESIWNNDFVQSMLKNKFLPNLCIDCLYKDKCMGGSRMNANIYNGSYNALDPLTNLNNKIIK